MKKIYSILLSAAACLMGLAACTQDYPVAEMARNLSVSPAEKALAAAGETFTATVTADGAWVATAPDWIVVEPACGDGGETVKITAVPNDGAERTDKVGFYSAVGDVSSTSITLESTPLAELEVTQAAAGQGGAGGAQAISIADYIALGENSDSYIITGVITRVVNTNYGNFDLTDETGTIYVYGLLNEELEAQKCWKEKELAMGDILTVHANNLQFYNGTTWEIVNAIYISHTKSLFDLESDSIALAKEGEDFEVKATVKGEDVKADFDADWISFKSAVKDGDNITLTFNAAENPGSPRSALIPFSTTSAKGETSATEFTVTQDGSIIDATVADVLAAEDDPYVLYRVTGYISKVNNLSKGRIYITDYTGTVYAFGTKVSGDSDSIDLTALGVEDGDIVTIIGYKTTYTSGSNSTIELMGYVEDFTKVEEVTVEQFLAKEVSADKWYRLKGIVTRPNEEETAAGNKFDLNTYGNFRLVDETGRAYVYGVLTGFGQTNSKLFGTLGVSEGDEITIVGKRAAYKGAAQVGSGWYVSHMTPTTPDTPEEPGNVVVFTDSQLPTAYPEAESTFTEGGYEYAFFRVANYGNGIQIQGNKGAYIYNKTAMPSGIKTITLTCHPSKTYYQGNLKVFAGTAEKPEGTAITGTLNDSGNVETFTVPAGCNYFCILNDSKYAVYLASVAVEL